MPSIAHAQARKGIHNTRGVYSVGAEGAYAPNYANQRGHVPPLLISPW